MIIQKGGGTAGLFLAACLFLLGEIDHAATLPQDSLRLQTDWTRQRRQIELSDVNVCVYQVPDCQGTDCTKKIPCVNGDCDEAGQCHCHPCFSGNNCTKYNDNYEPRFPVKEDKVTIEPDVQGAFYESHAIDEDRETTCKFKSNCPCATIYYAIRDSGDDASKNFVIDQLTGQISLKDGVMLQDQSQHELTIMAKHIKNGDEGGEGIVTDVQNLKVIVQSRLPLKDFSNGKKLPNAVPMEGKKVLVEDPLGDDHSEQSMMLKDNEDMAHVRKKRASAGVDMDTSAAKLTLTEDNPPSGDLKPGNSIDYTLTVILPTLTTAAMDLVIEVFVMDAVSGLTPFALCNPRVESIGASIQDENGAPLNKDVINANMVTYKNDAFEIFDRAFFDFGLVKNDDAEGDGTTNTGPSEVVIKFTAVTIQNTAYTNANATVTAGAEYDQEQYIWVSQASYLVDMNPTETYQEAVTMTGPTEIAEWSGGTYMVESFITDPFGDIELVVSSNGYVHDKFTISHMTVMYMGANWACTPDGVATTTYHESVSGRTVYRAVYKGIRLLKNLDYAGIATAITDDAFKITFAFSVFLVDAVVGDALSVTAGLLIGTNSIWTGTIAFTATAGSLTPTPGDPSAWALVSDISSTEVSTGGTVTYGAKATIPDGANAFIDCTFTGSADGEVCGVNYGEVGANIAYLPDLSEFTVFDGAGSATLQININSTGAGSNDIVFEVSVHFPTATIGSVTMACAGGFSETVTPTAGSAGIEDMSGEASSLVLGTDSTWYDGSQGGIMVTLKFPVNSVPYNSLILESAGDLEVSGWGPRVCKAEVMSAGKGVPCIAGKVYSINENYELQMAKDDSVFNDSAKIDLGSGCGVNRLSSTDSDYEVNIRVVYEMPPGQPSAATGPFNSSIGVNLDDTLIWTGWITTDFSTGAPLAADPLKPATLVYQDSAPQTVDVGVPYLTKLTLKMHPETVGVYTVTLTSSDSAALAICRVFLLNIGSHFPCVDPDPYHKEDEEYQVTKIVHNQADWGADVTISFGTLRNIGTGTIFSGEIADADSIEIGVVVRGTVPGGAGILTAELDNTGTAAVPITQDFTVSSVLPNTGTIESTVAQGLDGTADAFEGVMKMIEYNITVPVDYGQVLKMTVTNTAVTTISVCTGGVFKIGKNLPCLIPALVISNKTVTDTEEVLVIDFLQVCHYPVVDDPTENSFTVQVGVMFLEAGANTATISAVITEGTTDLAPITFDVNQITTPFVAPAFSSDGMKLELLDNLTTTVTVGQRLKTAIAFTIPADVTVPLQVGIMTPSDEGRAYVTVHGFSVRAGGGKNLGCVLSNCDLYQPQVVQNSSFDVPMIHESQTDTLLADMKYITNTGMTHLHKTALPEDDQLWLEADILIADHPNATTLVSAVFGISFAIKAGNLIYVIEKELTLSHTGSEAIDVGTELEITDDNTTPYQPGDKIAMTARMWHVVNVSTEEANNARMRLYLPKYVALVNDTALGTLDMWEPNIPGIVYNQQYIDYDISHLFFTDNFEINFTLTVDPNDVLPKGLGVVNATTIMRLVCDTNNDLTVRYCGNTSYVMYEINGPDCFDSLGLSTMQDCQFAASTAISADVSPDKAKSGSGAGWSPAARSGSDWEHYIIVDFLKKTRVTKIVFEPVSSTRAVTKFRMQFSHSGGFFSDACPNVLEVVNNEIELPLECRFEARYGRILIVEADGTEGTAPIGVRFDWFGCPVESVDAPCNPSLKTALTDTTVGWRHVALDDVHNIFYFCDFIPKKKRVQCYSTLDGEVWNALPSYIGRLVGFDATTSKMYAKDRKERAMVASLDGINWGIVDSTLSATIETTIDASQPAQPVSGNVDSMLVPVTLGDWQADYNGISLGGVPKVKWTTCCS